MKLQESFATAVRRRGRESWYLAIFLLMISAVILILSCTRYGVGIGSDGVVYIGAARNLIEGRGVSWISAGNELRPLVIFGPLYPSILAGLGLLGVDPLVGARWLNAGLFGINVILVGAILYWFAKEVWLALLGSLLVLFSRVLFGVHSSVLSESLFFPLLLVGVLLLTNYLEQGKRWYLVASALVLGLAYLARYAGMFFVVGGVLTLILLHQSSWRRRLADTVLWIVCAGTPIGLWMLRNQLLTGSSTYRTFSPILPGLNLLTSLVDFVTFWFLPERVPLKIRLVSVLLFGALLIGAWTWLMWKERSWQTDYEGYQRRHFLFPVVLGVMIVVYIVGLVATRSFFIPRIDIISRTLSPAYLLTLILILVISYGLVRKLDERNLIKNVLLICCYGLVLTYIVRGTIGAIELQQDAQGYANSAWRQSPLINAMKLLPPETPIYTNEIEAIYLLADRYAYRLPYGCLPDDMLISKYAQAECQSEQYLAWVERMRQKLEHDHAVIVLFNTFNEQAYAPLIPELIDGLSILSIQGDGAMYVQDLDEWPPNPHW